MNDPVYPMRAYCNRNECKKIQWGELHLRGGKPACPDCGEPAKQIIGFFGEPGWAHARRRMSAKRQR